MKLQSAISYSKFQIKSSAADKMHDFYFVGVFNLNRFPILLPNDFFVEFDGDALLRQREIFEQFA